MNYLVLVDVVADEGVHPGFDSRLDRRLTKLIHSLGGFLLDALQQGCLNFNKLI